MVNRLNLLSAFLALSRYPTVLYNSLLFTHSHTQFGFKCLAQGSINKLGYSGTSPTNPSVIGQLALPPEPQSPNKSVKPVPCAGC